MSNLFDVLTEFATHQQGAKSIHVIVYQILTKHVSALRRFGNNLVNAILNITEIATWPVAVAFLFLGNSMVCLGDSCTIQWVITVLALVMLYASLPSARGVCILEGIGN